MSTCQRPCKRPASRPPLPTSNPPGLHGSSANIGEPCRHRRFQTQRHRRPQDNTHTRDQRHPWDNTWAEGTTPVQKAHAAATASIIKLTVPHTPATSTPTLGTCVAATAPADNALELGDISAPKTAIATAATNKAAALWTAHTRPTHRNNRNKQCTHIKAALHNHQLVTCSQLTPQTSTLASESAPTGRFRLVLITALPQLVDYLLRKHPRFLAIFIATSVKLANSLLKKHPCPPSTLTTETPPTPRHAPLQSPENTTMPAPTDVAPVNHPSRVPGASNPWSPPVSPKTQKTRSHPRPTSSTSWRCSMDTATK